MQKVVVNATGFGKNTATGVFLLLQPLVGALSDPIGRRPLLLAFGFDGALVTVPVTHALATLW